MTLKTLVRYLLPFVVLLNGCASGFRFMVFGNDTRTVVVQTLNAFDQSSDASTDKLPAIRDNWIFRRERLAMLDETLRSNKADIFFLQQARQRRESPVDSDDVILMAGVLSGFDTSRFNYPTRQAEEDSTYLLTAVSPPLKLIGGKFLSPEDQGKLLTLDGVVVSMSVVEIENLPVVIMNVDVDASLFPKTKDVYSVIGKSLDAIFETGKVCANRVAIGGTLPGDKDDEGFKDFLSKYDLVDAAPDICLESDACPTLSPENELYAQVASKAAKLRVDKVLVHKNNDVMNSGISFNKVYPAPDYIKTLGINKLTVSTHFGWAVEVKFSRCYLSSS